MQPSSAILLGKQAMGTMTPGEALGADMDRALAMKASGEAQLNARVIGCLPAISSREIISFQKLFSDFRFDRKIIRRIDLRQKDSIWSS